MFRTGGKGVESTQLNHAQNTRYYCCVQLISSSLSKAVVNNSAVQTECHLFHNMKRVIVTEHRSLMQILNISEHFEIVCYSFRFVTRARSSPVLQQKMLYVMAILPTYWTEQSPFYSLFSSLSKSNYLLTSGIENIFSTNQFSYLIIHSRLSFIVLQLVYVA